MLEERSLTKVRGSFFHSANLIVAVEYSSFLTGLYLSTSKCEKQK